MTPFAGWEMPLLYRGILAEHEAVRTAAGLFDISHMGEIRVHGTGAAAWLDTMLTNALAPLPPRHAHYSLLLNEAGGVIDDLILYRLATDDILIIANASRYVRVADLLREAAPPAITVNDQSAETAALALQGPMAAALFEAAFHLPLPSRNQIVETHFDNAPLLVAGTGYTGERGCEFFFPTDIAGPLWDHLFSVGGENLLPCGLAARDSLRLEMAYPLNGQDLDEIHTPLEAGLQRFVKLEKAAFTGSDALRRQLADGIPTRLTAFEMTGKCPPPRHGCSVHDADGAPLGVVTSGTQSPSLQKGIGLAYLPLTSSEPGHPLTIRIRNQPFPARTTRKPFYQAK